MLTQRQTATSTTRSQAAPRPQKLPYALPCHTPILPQQPLICSLSLQVHIFKNVLLKASRTLQPLGTGWLHSARCLWASFPRLRSILSNDVPACPSSPSLTRMSMVPIGFGDYNQGCYKHDKVLCEPKFSFLYTQEWCPWAILQVHIACSKKLHSVPQSGCALLYSPQQYMNVPNCCDVCQHLVLLVDLFFESAPSWFIFS